MTLGRLDLVERDPGYTTAVDTFRPSPLVCQRQPASQRHFEMGCHALTEEVGVNALGDDAVVILVVLHLLAPFAQLVDLHPRLV